MNLKENLMSKDPTKGLILIDLPGYINTQLENIHLNFVPWSTIVRMKIPEKSEQTAQ